MLVASKFHRPLRHVETTNFHSIDRVPIKNLEKEPPQQALHKGPGLSTSQYCKGIISHKLDFVITEDLTARPSGLMVKAPDFGDNSHSLEIGSSNLPWVVRQYIFKQLLKVVTSFLHFFLSTVVS